MFTLIHAIIGYFFLLLTVRVLVRRPGAQLTPFEFVLIFLIGGVIILATVGDDRSVTNCTCAVIMIGLLHRMMAILRSRYPSFARWVDGVPIVLLRNGRWQMEAMEGLHVDPNDVMAAAREQSVISLSKVKYAILERTGGITVVENQSKESA